MGEYRKMPGKASLLGRSSHKLGSADGSRTRSQLCSSSATSLFPTHRTMSCVAGSWALAACGRRGAKEVKRPEGNCAAGRCNMTKPGSEAHLSRMQPPPMQLRAGGRDQASGVSWRRTRGKDQDGRRQRRPAIHEHALEEAACGGKAWPAQGIGRMSSFGSHSKCSEMLIAGARRGRWFCGAILASGRAAIANQAVLSRCNASIFG